jgi:hypothetical protein
VKQRPPWYDPRLSPQDIDAITEAIPRFNILSMQVVGPDEVKVRTGFVAGGTCGRGRIFRAWRSEGKWLAVDRGGWVS